MSTAIELHVDAISCSGQHEQGGGRRVEGEVKKKAERVEQGQRVGLERNKAVVRSRSQWQKEASRRSSSSAFRKS